MVTLSDERTYTMLERALLEWCSPVLVGLKPAGMFSLGRVCQVGMRADGSPIVAGCTPCQAAWAIEQAARSLARTGVRLRVLAHRRASSLVFAWRPDVLAAFVGRDPEATMLEVEGYDVASAERCVDRLQERMLSFDARPRNPDGTDRFPHEVGFLLGYPLEDVLGFVRTRERAQERGWWNVYSDVSRARRVFAAYDDVTRECRRMHAGGTSLAHIAAGAPEGRADSPATALALYGA